jgi:hypothetical protein
MRRLLVLSVILILFAACSPSKSTKTQATGEPSKIQKSQNEFLEIQGNMKSDGEIWALLFFETAHTNEDEKIVWRVTGEVDELHAEARSEEGTIITPIWVEYHGGSNWQRPGQEWGTGFNFPTPGCWRITVTRGETTGEIDIEVLGQ